MVFMSIESNYNFYSFDLLEALPPEIQEAREKAEIKRMMEERFGTKIQDEDIHPKENGYVVITGDFQVEFGIRFLQSEDRILGPAQFEIYFIG